MLSLFPTGILYLICGVGYLEFLMICLVFGAHLKCFSKRSVAWYRCVLYIWPSLVPLRIGGLWVLRSVGWAPQQ